MPSFELRDMIGMAIGLVVVVLLSAFWVRGTRAGRFDKYDPLAADPISRPLYFRAVQLQLLCAIVSVPSLLVLAISRDRAGEPSTWPFLISFGLMLFLTGLMLAYQVVVGFKIGECVANRLGRVRLNSKLRTHPITFWLLQVFFGGLSVAITGVGGIMGLGTIAILVRSALMGQP
jgi:hypothetical protein